MSVERYLRAAVRQNTQRSYASAIGHFEQEWKGFLPATSDAIANYLAHYAGELSVGTLHQRVAALAQWHLRAGFPDPTKAEVVRQVLRGIRTVHGAPEKRARPVQLDVLERVDAWLQQAIQDAKHRRDAPDELRHTRGRALLLLGFWRGFRSDELIRLQIENIEQTPEGLSCYIVSSKTDRNAEGRTVFFPALSRLCPVAAYENWLSVSGLTSGPVFRGIDRWGHIRTTAMDPDSVIPLLRGLFEKAGLDDASTYSSHSLRRGFASWANANGWGIQDLMEYVGWRDINSAVRYIEMTPEQLKVRLEHGLQTKVATPEKATDEKRPVRLKPRLRLVDASDS